MSTNVVSTSLDIMGGTPVLPGTRVPAQTLGPAFQKKKMEKAEEIMARYRNTLHVLAK
jgi:hypothetical protein